jgi:hypothetical protein
MSMASNYNTRPRAAEVMVSGARRCSFASASRSPTSPAASVFSTPAT